MDRKIKTAIIGFGPHGKRIFEVVSRIEELEFSGVVDSNPASFNGVDIGGQSFKSTHDFYVQVKPELVIIATNGPSHKALTLEAIDHGAKFVMVEKPMACSIEECMIMEASASASKVRLSVDQSRRHDPFYSWLKSQISEGSWGQLRTIYIQRPGIGLGCLGIHSFDLASFLVGTDPIEVTGWIDNPILRNPRGDQFIDPGGSVVINFSNQVKAFILQVEDGSGPMSVEINLTGARIKIDEKSGVVEITKKDTMQKTGPGIPTKFETVTLPHGLTAKTSMLVMLEGVLRELIGNKELISGGDAGKLSMEVLVGAYISSEMGHVPIQLPLTEPEHIKKYLPIT